MSKKVIIDTDGGADDAFALFLACFSNEIEILGITTVEGNIRIDDVNNNVLKILSLANRNDINVYSGEVDSFDKESSLATDVFGENGLSNIKFEPVNRSVSDISAVDFMIDMVNKYPNEVFILSIGPLTNVAKAIKTNEEFSKNIKELVLMGGTTLTGNITPYAEFNIYRDSIAADIVLNSSINKIVMIGLNVTHQIPLNENLENILLKENTEISKFLYDGSRLGAKFDRSKGHDGSILNDPLIIAYILDENIVKLTKSKTSVVTTGEKKGQCINDFNSSDANVFIATDIDVNKFYKLLFKNIFNIDL